VRAAIVDDEPLARARLERLLKAVEAEVVSFGENGFDAVNIASQSNVDILFLDINMPLMSGLEAAFEISESIANPPAIVFCTAYDEYAIDAFKVNAVSYLLKPFSQTELNDAIKKAKKLTRLQLNTITNPQNDEIAVTSSSEYFKLKLAEIMYFYSQEKYTYARLLDNSSVMIDSTLKVLEDEFKGSCIRAHRACLVRRSAISRIFRDNAGSWQISLIDSDQTITISRRHLAEVKACFESV